MKKLVIVGAGGFGREIAWQIQKNKFVKYNYDILGFVDDCENKVNTYVNGYKVIGNLDWLLQYEDFISVVVCIANVNIRKKIIQSLKENPKIDFPVIICDNVSIADSVFIGEGTIICEYSLISTNTNIGKHCIIDYHCSIGHDVVIKDLVTIYPGSNIAGNILIDKFVEIGSGVQIIQGKNICSKVVIGAGSVVIKNICNDGTYVGVPAKRIEK